jgi:hypothetical protein
VEAVCRLKLRTPSAWPVFVAVLTTWARYGRTEARLTVDDLVRMTGLSARTVKAALALLLKRGLLARRGRYGRLVVQLGGAVHGAEGSDRPDDEGPVKDDAGGASLSAPPRCKHVCTSPTSVNSSSTKVIVVSDPGTFSDRQQALIEDVLAEATELLGTDAGDLPLGAKDAGELGLAAGTTYSQGRRIVDSGGNRAQAGRFVRAVLRLRQDPRVLGHELDLGP